MSFGFSVGDIVLATKLTIQLYQIVAKSFTTASTEIKELSDSLYSLRCSLNHLGNHAVSLAKALGNASSPITGSGTSDQVDTTEGLNHMIQSCLSTLKELDSMTKKYKEAVGVIEPHSGGQSIPALDPSLAKAQQKKQPGIREKIRINWLKIRWDLGKSSIDGYRVRLDSHTNSITMLLVTFQSQITLKTNEDNKQWQDKILSLQIKTYVASPGTVAAKTIKPKPTEPDPVSSSHPQRIQPGTPQLPAATPEQASIMPCLGGMSKVTADFPSVTKPVAHPPTAQAVAYSGVDYPATQRQADSNDITLLNIQRKAVGGEQFARYQNQYQLKPPLHSQKAGEPPCPPSAPTPLKSEQMLYSLPIRTSRPIRPFKFLQTENLNIPHLQEGLKYIFRPLPEATRRQSTSNYQARMQETAQWMREFDLFIASSKVVGNGSSDGDTRKGSAPSLENGMIDLLSELNDTLEICEDRIKSAFYRSVKEAEFQKTVDKLLGVFKSVRGRGAVEEFLDVMEEWEGRNAG